MPERMFCVFFAYRVYRECLHRICRRRCLSVLKHIVRESRGFCRRQGIAGVSHVVLWGMGTAGRGFKKSLWDSCMIPGDFAEGGISRAISHVFPKWDGEGALPRNWRWISDMVKCGWARTTRGAVEELETIRGYSDGAGTHYDDWSCQGTELRALNTHWYHREGP